MRPGDIVLAQLPQADGQLKNRPALVLGIMPPFGDLLVCGISSHLHHVVKGFDEIIDLNDSDYCTSGLKAPSLIRLGFLAVLPLSSLTGSIGAVSEERHQRIVGNLCHYLQQDIS